MVRPCALRQVIVVVSSWRTGLTGVMRVTNTLFTTRTVLVIAGTPWLGGSPTVTAATPLGTMPLIAPMTDTSPNWRMSLAFAPHVPPLSALLANTRQTPSPSPPVTNSSLLALHFVQQRQSARPDRLRYPRSVVSHLPHDRSEAWCKWKTQARRGCGRNDVERCPAEGSREPDVVHEALARRIATDGAGHRICGRVRSVKNRKHHQQPRI